MKPLTSCLSVICLALAGCASDSSPSAPAGSTLAAPTPSSPADAAQLSSLRPTFVVTNAASAQGGAKLYEFQVSDRSDFSAPGPRRPVS